MSRTKLKKQWIQKNDKNYLTKNSKKWLTKNFSVHLKYSNIITKTYKS